MKKQPCGLYIHIPFCNGKCPYCDFYSVAPQDSLLERYAGALIAEMEQTARRILPEYGRVAVDTVYFGGGTPPLLGGERLASVLNAARRIFDIASDAEITVEMNPLNATDELLAHLAAAGFDRVSMGAQSGVDSELAALGRRHTAAQVTDAVKIVRRAGIDNLSLDLMLAIPGQTEASLARSVSVIAACEPQHISAYLLKLEPGTSFYERRESLCLPDDDRQAQMYLLTCELLEQAGYYQYEISNFSVKGKESRHNLKYWNCEPYLGFGPSAHSCFNDRRFFYPRELVEFIDHPCVVDDSSAGGEDEYIMLRLRLAEGLTADGWRRRFGGELPARLLDKARPLAGAGLLECDGRGIRLKRAGFIVSNAVIGRLLD